MLCVLKVALVVNVFLSCRACFFMIVLFVVCVVCVICFVCGVCGVRVFVVLFV